MYDEKVNVALQPMGISSTYRFAAITLFASYQESDALQIHKGPPDNHISISIKFWDSLFFPLPAPCWSVFGWFPQSYRHYLGHSWHAHIMEVWRVQKRNKSLGCFSFLATQSNSEDTENVFYYPLFNSLPACLKFQSRFCCYHVQLYINIQGAKWRLIGYREEAYDATS